MELLRLRRRRILAQRGHSLLQDKLEKLISEFHKLIRDFKVLALHWDREFRDFFEDFLILRIQTSLSAREELFKSIPPLDIEIHLERLLNLKLPHFSFKEQRREMFSPKYTPCQWDRVVQKKVVVSKLLFRVSELFFSLKLVGAEILKTRRRVNALEYILVPQIKESIKLIEDKLVELEREFLSRLLRIKDLIRE